MPCDFPVGEGFILVNNEEDGTEGGSRASGSGDETDGGYRSINGNNSPTVHDLRSGVTTIKDYGSINRSRSDGRQAAPREPRGEGGGEGDGFLV